jgi:branched-chain amino acid transport system ATP-binding protein
MLQVNNIEVIYSDVILVLKGLSLVVPQGHIVALLGANGAGKSTTLKAISGLLKSEEGEVTDGEILFEGAKINGKDAEEIVRRGIFQVMEGRRVFEDLTVEENLRCGAHTRKDGKNVKGDYDRVYTYFPQIKERRKQLAGYLSGGEQQMLAIGRALMARPKLMLLDEPSLGLSRVALSISSYGYIMENGKVVLDGETDKLANNEDVKEFYLGMTEVGTRKSYKDTKHYRRRKRWLS